MVGGISTGHRDITAGTLGCFCRGTAASDSSDQILALSNNHVFANVNQAIVNDPLYQPGPADGGSFADYFAKLHRYVPIALGGTVPNRVDCAVGSLLPDVAVNTDICQIGAISGTLTGEDGMRIRKHGRTTGLTEGNRSQLGAAN